MTAMQHISGEIKWEEKRLQCVDTVSLLYL